MFDSTISSPDNLIAGASDVIAVEATIASGAGKLARGTVLGKITANGLCKIVNSAGADDGTRTAYAILAENVDATSGNVVTSVYVAGEFAEDALTFGGSDTANTHRYAMQSIDLIIRPSVGVN